MSKPFTVFDIDGTLIRWQLYHAVADALAKRGHIDPTTYREIRDARMLWKRRTHEESFKDYERRLVTGYEKLITQLTVAQFEEAAQAVFDEYKDQVYTYTRNLIKDLKAKGYLLFAISGSQTEIVEHIATYHGFDDCVGSTYAQKAGRFTGTVSATLGKKDQLLKKLATKHGATSVNSVAVGDSESDIAMLESVERPIAFNPTRKLFTHAAQKGWQIVVERKNVVYEIKSEGGRYTLATAL
jgi:HAD superfamily hydrolase (TIGR01490 family)